LVKNNHTISRRITESSAAGRHTHWEKGKTFQDMKERKKREQKEGAKGNCPNPRERTEENTLARGSGWVDGS